MQDSFKAYSIKVTILTITITVVGFFFCTSILHQSLFKTFPFIVVLFYASSLVVFYLINKLTTARPQKFIPMYTLFTGIKFLFYTMSLLILLFAWRSDAIKTAITFGTCYFIYTGFEVYSVLKNLK